MKDSIVEYLKHTVMNILLAGAHGWEVFAISGDENQTDVALQIAHIGVEKALTKAKRRKKSRVSEKQLIEKYHLKERHMYSQKKQSYLLSR